MRNSTSVRKLPAKSWTAMMRQSLHDLRTPLTTLYGYSDLITKKKTESEMAQKLALEVQRSVVQIDAFLDVLALRCDRFQSVFSECDLGELIKRTTEWAGRQYPTCKLVFMPPRAKVMMKADEHQLATFFMVLFLFLLNGQKNTTKKLSISLELGSSVVCVLHVNKQRRSFQKAIVPANNSFFSAFFEEVMRLHQAQLTWDIHDATAPAVKIKFTPSSYNQTRART